MSLPLFFYLCLSEGNLRKGFDDFAVIAKSNFCAKRERHAGPSPGMD